MSRHSNRGRNQTVVVTKGIIVSAAVLVMLMDGGITHFVFQAIAGTTGFFIHNMTVNDLPPELRKHARDVILSEQNMIQGASILAGIGIALNPIVGGIFLALAIIGHMHMDDLRREELKALKAIVEEVGGVCYA